MLDFLRIPHWLRPVFYVIACVLGVGLLAWGVVMLHAETVFLVGMGTLAFGGLYRFFNTLRENRELHEDREQMEQEAVRRQNENIRLQNQNRRLQNQSAPQLLENNVLELNENQRLEQENMTLKEHDVSHQKNSLDLLYLVRLFSSREVKTFLSEDVNEDDLEIGLRKLRADYEIPEEKEDSLSLSLLSPESWRVHVLNKFFSPTLFIQLVAQCDALHKSGSEDTQNNAEAIFQDATRRFFYRVARQNDPHVLSTFSDPFTGDFLDDPVELPTGYTFNRKTVEGWYDQNSQPHCPITKILLPPRDQLTLPANILLLGCYRFLKNNRVYEIIREVIVALQPRGSKHLSLPHQRLHQFQAEHQAFNAKHLELSFNNFYLQAMIQYHDGITEQAQKKGVSKDEYLESWACDFNNHWKLCLEKMPLENLLENFSDQISRTFLNNPVILSSGRFVNEDTAKVLVSAPIEQRKCPWTKEPLAPTYKRNIQLTKLYEILKTVGLYEPLVAMVEAEIRKASDLNIRLRYLHAAQDDSSTEDRRTAQQQPRKRKSI